jgi:hypothetical protein
VSADPAAATGAHARTPAAPTPAAGPDDRRRDAGWAALGGVLAALVFLLVRDSLIDDAYITLSYARNLAEHLHWGLTPYRTANSATSPLNVLLLGAAAFVVRDPVWGLGLTSVLLTAAMGGGLSRLARRLQLTGVTTALGLALLVLSPLMLSVVGMEMTLAVTLLVWLAVAAVEERPVLLGLLTAALLLTRVDLLLFPLVLLALPGVRRRAGRSLLVAALAAAPWYLFSWWVLGALVPDTLVLKTVASAGWGKWHFGNGPYLYLREYPVAAVLTALPALAGVAALGWWAARRAWQRPRFAGLGVPAALGVAGVLHFLAYTLLSPPPYHWYYAPSVGALTLVAAVAAGTTGRGRPAAPAPAARRLPALAPLAAGVLLVVADLGTALARPLPWDVAPVMTNWATAAEYRTTGEAIAPLVAGQVVSSPGEIGTLAYWCRCDIVDSFSDPGRLEPLIAERRAAAGPVMRLLLQANFANHDVVPAAVPTRALVWLHVPATAGAWPADSPWRGPGSFQLRTLTP